MQKSHLLVALGVLAFFLIGSAPSSFSDGWPVPPKPSVYHPKIETALLLESSRGRGFTGSEPLNSRTFEPMNLTVVIESERSLNESLLARFGARIEARAGNLSRVRVPAENLRALAESVPEISFIRRPRSLVALGTRASEGVVPTGALLLQGAGWRGQDIKIAVIDLGFAQLSRAKKSKIIHPNVIVDEHDYTDTGLETGTAHGTGVAEIIHAMAPQAWLYLKKVADEIDLAKAVNDAIAQGVQIINYSVGVANANFGDGTGIVAELADRARAHGILWVNAAGNHAQSHWMGTFSDRDYNGWLEFAPGREELLIKADFPGSIELYLTWDDWPRTAQDFDLFLYDAQGRLVTSSQNYQTGSEEPTEQIEYVAWAPGTYRARVLARRVSKTNIRLKIFNLSQQALDPNVPAGSILTPADARGALAVGAISVRNWKTGPQEPFSSQGPTSDGRIKPDIAGPDGVSSFALTYFPGTSASAPHVAGAAALLLSQHPNWTADQLQSALEAQAIDMGVPGKDNIYGAGRLDLSLGTIQARRTISPKQAKPGDLITVTIAATMPMGLFGGLELREAFPSPLLPSPSQGRGAGGEGAEICQLQNENDYLCIWPVVHPGETKAFIYELRVPETAHSGVYRWSGTVNTIAIAGDNAITIESPKEMVTVTLAYQRDMVRVQLSAPVEMARLRIYDLKGAVLLEAVTQNSALLAWRPQRRANGVYLYVLEIVQDGRITQRKLGKFVVLK
ncbi:MAG: S8 family serine peptidase [Candidatus Bipolaricaulota bacterium]|nr:S8 family serine peptidase [Candidatus Bipolaricaulota bacterium]